MTSRKPEGGFREEPYLPELLGDEEGVVDEEIRFYLEMRTRDLMEGEGLEEEEARRRAEEMFGDVERVRRAVRREAVRGSAQNLGRRMMGGWSQDLTFALRTAFRRPLFTLTIVLTLGLGIGAATAIFSVVDATLLRPLPFEDPGRIVLLRGFARTPEGPRIRGASPAEIADWEQMSRSFQDVAVSDGAFFNLSGDGGAERVQGEFVSAGYFELLGAEPIRGRTFLPEEDLGPGSGPVAILSEALWERRFGRDDGILGRTIEVDGLVLTIVGVMPRSFSGVPLSAHLWIPASMIFDLGIGSTPDARGTRWIIPVARLADGVALEEAQADLTAVAARLEGAYPETNTDRSAFVTPLREAYLGNTRQLVLILLGAVGLLLLLACANVANLLLVRATSRSSDVLMRVALGAGKARILRQFLVEGLVLAGLGAGLGLGLAWSGLGMAERLIPAGVLPSYAELALDVRVFAFAVGATGLVGVLAGMAPGFTLSRMDVAEGLKSGAKAVVGGSSQRLRALLVGGEVALALVLLVGAVLMMRSFQEQLGVRPGFDAERILAFRLQIPETRYSREELAPFVQRLEERLATLPGVESVAMGSSMPLRDRSSGAFLYLPERPDIERVRFYLHRVTPGYFNTLGIPLLRGRPVRPDDGIEANVVVASRGLVERFYPDRDPVGERIHLGGDDGPAFTIVGVVDDARYRDLTSDLAAGEDDPDVYIPYTRAPDRSFDVAVRTRLDPAALTSQVREAVAAVDPSLAVFDLAPLASELRQETGQGRFGSALLGVFSALAVVLAAVGIYGVLASLVGQRSREIAIRMAVGADHREVRGMVVRRGLQISGMGLVVGLAGALALSRTLDGFLFGVSGTDPVTYVGVGVSMLAVAWCAAWIPARRATSLDPQTVLREE